MLRSAIVIALPGGLRAPYCTAVGFPNARVTRKVPFFCFGACGINNFNYPELTWRESLHLRLRPLVPTLARRRNTLR